MINIKVHLLFEQSGSFKEAFRELGYEAYDYDIENQFGKTDFQIDIFNEIELAYNNKLSMFDKISSNDLIVSFFPCTYFSVQNELIWSRKVYNFRNWSEEKINEYIRDREKEREKFFQTLLKYIEVVKRKNLRMIFENPYHKNYLLSRSEIKKPDVVIKDRRELGDNHIKPTAFWFYNYEPTTFSEHIFINFDKVHRHNEINGILRSQIHPDFARNFINMYILGK